METRVSAYGREISVECMSGCLVGNMKACRHKEYHRSWDVQITYTSESEEVVQTYKV